MLTTQTFKNGYHTVLERIYLIRNPQLCLLEVQTDAAIMKRHLEVPSENRNVNFSGSRTSTPEY